MLAGPSLDRRASGLVPAQTRRLHSIRRESAQEIRGHRQPGLLLSRQRTALDGAARRAPVLDRAGGSHLSRRQPAHQAVSILGVADPRGSSGRSQRHLPGGSLHAPEAHEGAGQAGFQPVLHLFHLAHRQGRAAGLFERNHPRSGAGIFPAELLREHARHPAAPAAGRRALGVQGARRPRRHAVGQLWNLQRLRAHRARGLARPGGISQLGKIRGEGPGLGSPRQYQGLYRPAQFDPQEQSGLAADRQPAICRRRRQRGHRVRQGVGRGRQRGRGRGRAQYGGAARILVPFRRHRDRTAGLAQPHHHRRKHRHRRASRPRVGRHPAAHRSGAGSRPALSLSCVRGRVVNVLSEIKAEQQLNGDELWFKDAIVYQLHVKAFADSNNDGIGDFAGLTERLDYLEDLGVTALWLLPFYPSPGRDDGYDISDYRTINADFGTMTDFRRFMQEARRRKLRVLTELVINHTSDQHPWFVRARQSKPTSDARNWYVWSDHDHAYAGTRIIFSDTEKSNWAWDPLAGAYYWHRFFSHQPDLNYDNPRVLAAMIQIMRRWLDLGVDGFRLGAIPYLCERERTNNENLPETHAIIKNIRAELDSHSRGKLLLAEANQWPEDVSAYFADGDECHMAYHFPLMPRIYMAIAQEDRFPITDILRQTPDIPSNCQWALFLRNHDELTL